MLKMIVATRRSASPKPSSRYQRQHYWLGRLLVSGMCLLGLSGLPAPAVLAQASSSGGRLEGTVADASGGILPAAAVTARNTATGIAAQQSTGPSGHFLFPNLSPGAYELTIEKEGFTTAHLKALVQVGTTTSLAPVLGVGKIEATVDVTSGRPLLDTSTSAVSTVIGQDSIGTLPLNGRNFIDYVLLTPGTTTDGDFGMVSFNGVAGNFNNYSVDGANNNNAFFSQQIGRGTIPFQFSEDVIQEFQVTSNGFEAEFGQSGGGVVNSVTKGGANELHGDAYYYILDSKLNENDAINKENGIAKPANRRQQFGASLSGPLVHDKLFYFVNYEGQVRNEPLTVNAAPALVGLPPDFLTQNPTLANQVSQSSGSFPRSFNQNAAFLKLSGTLGAKNTFHMSYNFQRFVSPHGYFTSPTSTGDSLSLTDSSKSHFFQASLFTTVSSTSFNELRVHIGDDHHEDLPPSPTSETTTTIQNPDTGFVFGGNRFQLSTTDRRYEIADNFTKLSGRHTLKGGVDINFNHDTDYFVYGPKGEYRFGDLQSVASGSFELYLQSFGQPSVTFTVPTYSAFVQDDFRVSSRLSLNYGLRYDLQKLTQPSVCNPAFPPTCKVPVDYNNFAPRVGFAYKLGANGHTVVRGAAGIFYIQEDLLDLAQALTENGISRQFFVTTGPAFGNDNPPVTYPNTLPAFPAGGEGTPSLNTFDPNFKNPYVEQANLSVEHQVGDHTTVSASYVYTHGVKLLGGGNGVTRQAITGFDVNLVPPERQTDFGGSFNSDVVTLPGGQNFTVPDASFIDGFLNPSFGGISVVNNTGKSTYHALQILVRQASEQFHATLAYTLSRAVDQGTGYYNQFDLPSQRGPSLLDQKHRLAVSGTWSPVGRGLKGFVVSAVGTFASGHPYSALFDNPELNFQLVPGEKFNSFRAPGIQDVDLTVSRGFQVGSKARLRATAQAYNIFNHANFQPAVDQVQYTTTQLTDADGNGLNRWTAEANPHFGSPLAISSRNGSRNLQFALRLEF